MWHPAWKGDAEWFEREVRRMAKTPKQCSCWMCSNRRRHEGPSVPEQRRAPL
jgi:hypothetical protein